jgi:hypothetical protein
MRHFFYEDGDAPIHYVQFDDANKSAFDKQLFPIFANERRWDWITNPVPHKTEILDYLARRGEPSARVFAEFGRLVLDTGSIKVYELDRKVLDRENVAAIGNADTRIIDFSDDSSTKHKVMGIQYNEKSDSGAGFAWTVSRQQKRYRFTMKGLLHLDAGPPTSTAVLNLRQTPARRRIRVNLLGGTPDQQVEVVLNGHSLGRAVAPPEWTELTFDAPKGAFDPSGLQTLEIRAAKLNEYKLGVAIRWVRIDPLDDAP